MMMLVSTALFFSSFIVCLLFLPVLATSSFDASVCPGSPVSVHAKCSMTIEFPNTSCDLVLEEVLLRLHGSSDGASSWTDPHNHGTYTLLNQSSSHHDDGSSITTTLEASRTTGNGKYTDLMGLSFVESKDVVESKITPASSASLSSCKVQACSESQVTSILDASTNYCNLRNLYSCESNDDEDCGSVKHSFHAYGDYTEGYDSCWQRDVSKCVVKSTGA